MKDEKKFTGTPGALLDISSYRRPYVRPGDPQKQHQWETTITTENLWPHGHDGIGVFLRKMPSGWIAYHNDGKPSNPKPSREQAIESHLPVMFAEMIEWKKETDANEAKDYADRARKGRERARSAHLADCAPDMLQVIRDLLEWRSEQDHFETTVNFEASVWARAAAIRDRAGVNKVKQYHSSGPVEVLESTNDGEHDPVHGDTRMLGMADGTKIYQVFRNLTSGDGGIWTDKTIWGPDGKPIMRTTEL